VSFINKLFARNSTRLEASLFSNNCLLTHLINMKISMSISAEASGRRAVEGLQDALTYSKQMVTIKQYLYCVTTEYFTMLYSVALVH
jgi:hypothetical protein